MRAPSRGELGTDTESPPTRLASRRGLRLEADTTRRASDRGAVGAEGCARGPRSGVDGADADAPRGTASYVASAASASNGSGTTPASIAANRRMPSSSARTRASRSRSSSAARSRASGVRNAQRPNSLAAVTYAPQRMGADARTSTRSPSGSSSRAAWRSRRSSSSVRSANFTRTRPSAYAVNAANEPGSPALSSTISAESTDHGSGSSAHAAASASVVAPRPKETPETASVCDLGGSGSDAGVAAAARSAATRAAKRPRGTRCARAPTPSSASGPPPSSAPRDRPWLASNSPPARAAWNAAPARPAGATRAGTASTAYILAAAAPLGSSGTCTTNLAASAETSASPSASSTETTSTHGPVGRSPVPMGVTERASRERTAKLVWPGARSTVGRRRLLSAPPALLDPPRASGYPTTAGELHQGFSCSSPSSTHSPCDRPTPRGSAVAETGSVVTLPARSHRELVSETVVFVPGAVSAFRPSSFSAFSFSALAPSPYTARVSSATGNRHRAGHASAQNVCVCHT